MSNGGRGSSIEPGIGGTLLGGRGAFLLLEGENRPFVGRDPGHPLPRQHLFVPPASTHPTLTKHLNTSPTRSGPRRQPSTTQSSAACRSRTQSGTPINP